MKISVPDYEWDKFHLLKSVWPNRFRIITYNPTTCTTVVQVQGPAQSMVALKYPQWLKLGQ